MMESMATSIFIVFAKGSLKHLSGSGQIISMRAFRSRASAEAYFDAFKILCTTDHGDVRDLETLSPTHLHVFAQELDLTEETVVTVPPLVV